MANSFIQYLRGDHGAPGERKLVQKLDFFILTFCCLMYFLNCESIVPVGREDLELTSLIKTWIAPISTMPMFRA